MLCRLVPSVFFVGYPENAKLLPHKNCVSCSRYKIIWKLASCSVKMTSLVKKHKNIMKVAYRDISKLCISSEGIKFSAKLPIFV